MTARFIDRKDSKHITRNHPDFVKRQYFTVMLWISYGFIVAIIACAFAMKWAVDTYFPHYDVIETGIAIGLVVMVLLCLYISILIKKVSQVVQLAEFQNMVFSSATKVGSLFCFIMDESFRIVYIDDSNKSVVSVTRDDSLEQFLQVIELDLPQQKQIKQALVKGVSQSVDSHMKDQKGKRRHIRMTVDPLVRPNGYFIVRGYQAVA